MKSEEEVRAAIGSWQMVAEMTVPEGASKSERETIEQMKLEAKFWIHGAEWVVS